MTRDDPVKRVAVVVVGDEVLAGDVEESNAAFLVRELNRIGASAGRVTILPDDEETIASELARLSKDFDAVLVTGGIGVTHDDVTRSAVARAVNLPLKINEEALAILKGRHGGEIDEWRARLVEFPHPCRLIPNPVVAAPGFIVENIYVFPGVPVMIREMFPPVADELAGPTVHKRIIFTRLSESVMAGPLGEIARSSPEVQIGSYPTMEDGEHRVRLVVKSRDREKLEGASRKVEEMLSSLGPER